MSSAARRTTSESTKSTLAPQPTSSARSHFLPAVVEREINRLENITSVRVLSTGGEIDEIHVIAPRKAAPKKIVRNIETLLLVRFGVRVDHRRVSIVQVDDAPEALPHRNRPRLERLTHADGVVRLSLAVEDTVISGEAQVTAENGELEASGRAVIHATEQFLASPGTLRLLASRILEMSEHRVALVLIHWCDANYDEFLLGASFVQDDPLNAMAQATLDAINHHLAQVTAQD